MKFSRQWAIALVILIAASLFLHTLSRGEAIRLRKRFAEFPLRIGSWTGQELGLAADVLKVLKVTDYMNRLYWDEQGGPPIGLYTGYYGSMRQGATYHSPKNCLPGSGWYFVKSGKTHLGIADRHGQAVEINRFVIQKGLEKQLVLYWYQDRGRIITSEYWAKFYLIWDAIINNRTDGAFVRVTVPIMTNDEERALKRGKAFAEKLFPLLQNYLPS